MKWLKRLSLLTLCVAVAGVVLGICGMFLGGAIARMINPRPNVHVMEGMGYVMLGTLGGVLLGAAGVSTLAVRQWKVEDAAEPTQTT